jgi:REP element-mobilizing transposase RayT
MTRKPETIAFWSGRLPHWEVEAGRYFITIHLAGAIPQAGKDEIRRASERLRRVASHNSADWLTLQRQVFHQMEAWLDRAAFNTWLRDDRVAEMVIDAIEHRHSNGDWNAFEYVIMPTHLHLFCEIGKRGLRTTIENFKRWTGHRACELLSSKPERFWQREWFDHWSRSDAEDDRIVAYIRNNPVKAGLADQYTSWPYRARNSRSLLPEGTSADRTSSGSPKVPLGKRDLLDEKRD